MIRRIGLLLLAVGILYSTCAWAQDDTRTSDDQTSAQPGPKPAFTYPDATPSLDFINGAVENSSITLGGFGGFAYDSNAYPSSVSPQGTQDRFLTNLGASIRLQQFRPKLSWSAGYTGGLQLFSQVSGTIGKYSNNNRYSQNANGNVLWQLARTWQLSATEQYVNSANPFDSYVSIPGTPTANNPNPVSYYPLTNFQTNLADLTISDRLSKTDTLAFSGTSNYRQTSTYNVVTAVPFYNLISWGGRASYQHQLSSRLTLGAGYDFNSLDFGHGQQRSGIQTMSLTADYLLRPNMTVSFWIGPEYTSTKTIVAVPILGQIFYYTSYSSLWSTALGANFGWQGRRNSLRAAFTHSVNDGGGIIATSQMNMATGTYRRGITSKLSADAAVRYLYDTSTTVSSRHYWNFNVSVSGNYQFNRSWAASATYSNIQQRQSNTFIIGTNQYKDNRVGVRVDYTWNHPLGR